MKPEQYTDDQLRLAILNASDQRKIFISTAYELEDIDSAAVRSLRTLLAHLTDPAIDEWQECGFNDFRPTDKRVKAEYASGTIIEGTPDRRTSGHVFLVDGSVIHAYDDATFYRIPAPVVHPDPAEHPVIIVHESTVLPKGSEPQKVMFVRPYYRNDIWNGAPETITEWEPADIVPKVVEDDR